MPLNLSQSRLEVNRVLTNLSQGFVQPEFCMRLAFPLAEVAEYGGQIVEFDDSDFEETNDDRADDGEYAEISDSYHGRPFTLQTKGLEYRVGHKKRKQMEALKINWARRAVSKLMNRAALKHEIEAATLATTLSLYETTNRLTLSGTDQFNDYDNSTPGQVIRSARSAVASQIGIDPNVLLMGRDVFDTLAEHPLIRAYIQYTSQESLTEDMLARMWGFERVRVCNALRKNSAGTKSRVFGKHIWLGYTNPAALNGDTIPYRPDSNTIDIETPSFGYTYVYQGNPLVYDPWEDKNRRATVYQLDFDRRVVLSGTNRDSGLITHAFLIQNAVA